MARARAPGKARTVPLGSRSLRGGPEASLPAWARTIGVTRVARVTGLDRCGVETACAIRPDGRLLQVSNGKGATFDEAKRAALSEAAELWASENFDPARCTWRAPGDDCWPASMLGGDLSVPLDPRAVTPWVEAERLDRPGRVFVPASHVACPPPGGGSVGPRTIGFTVNGVAAHPDRSAARWHGLLEVLEREALCRSMPDGWMPEHLAKRSLRTEHALPAKLASLGLVVHVVDVTPKGWPLPVVAALLVDPESRAASLAAGYACRTTPESAIDAALAEACQSRLTEIHGAREDVVQATDDVPGWLLEVPSRRRAPSSLPAWRGPMDGLLRALEVPAASVSLVDGSFPLTVERVFVPGFRLSELLL